MEGQESGGFSSSPPPGYLEDKLSCLTYEHNLICSKSCVKVRTTRGAHGKVSGSAFVQGRELWVPVKSGQGSHSPLMSPVPPAEE